MLTSIDDYEIYKSEVQDLGIDISGKIIPYFDVASVTGQTPLRGEDYCYLREMYQEIYRAVNGGTYKSFDLNQWYKFLTSGSFRYPLESFMLPVTLIKEDYRFEEEVESNKSLPIGSAYPDAIKRYDRENNLWVYYAYNRKKDFVRFVFYKLAQVKRFVIVCRDAPLRCPICIRGSYNFSVHIVYEFTITGFCYYDSRNASCNVDFDSHPDPFDFDLNCGSITGPAISKEKIIWVGPGKGAQLRNPGDRLSDRNNNRILYEFSYDIEYGNGTFETVFVGDIYVGFNETSNYKNVTAIVCFGVRSDAPYHHVYVPFECEKTRTGIGSYAEAFKIKGFNSSVEWYRAMISRFSSADGYVVEPEPGDEAYTNSNSYRVEIIGIQFVGSCDFRSEIDSLNWNWSPPVENEVALT